jgi:hypothetical protein
VTVAQSEAQLTLPRPHWKVSLCLVALCAAVGLVTAVLILKAKEQHVRRRIGVHAPEGGDATVFFARDTAATMQEGNAAGLHGFEVDGTLPRQMTGARVVAAGRNVL